MTCARGEKRESARELVRHSSNGERGGNGEKRKKKSAEEGPEALPPVAYMGGGGGEWDRGVQLESRVARCGRCLREAQPADQRRRSECWETRRATWGQGPAVTSSQAWVVGPYSLTARARIGRDVRRVLGRKVGRDNRWKAIGLRKMRIGRRFDFQTARR